MSPQASSAARLGYRPWLDGLRGIAITLVFIHHLQHFIYKGDPLFGWLPLPFGLLGVDVFFVLSGFLITTLLLEEHRDAHQISLKRFYIRRALRLLPAVLFFLFCMVMYSWMFLPAQEAISTARLSVIAIFYCANWFFAFGGSSDLLGHLWSLAVEEQFYLIWPFALSILLSSRLTKKQITTIIFALIGMVCIYRIALVPWVGPARIYFGSDTRADSLLVGCAVAMLVTWQLIPLRTARALKHLALIGVIIVAAYIFDWLGVASFTIYKSGFTVFALAVGIFILRSIVVPNNVYTRTLESSVLVWIGKLSYSLYLWHFFTIGITLRLPVPNYMRVLFSIPISLAIAAFSHYLIEKPFLRLKSRYASSASVPLIDSPPRRRTVVDHVDRLIGG